MTPFVKNSSAPQIKVLTESEIQQKLYGKYHGASPTPPWTGTEILSGELHRLRDELIHLKKEKERLAQELSQTQRTEAFQLSQPAERPSQTFTIRRILGRGLWSLLLLAGIGYPVGMRLLQASPTTQEFSPYTVQIAVYNLSSQAQRSICSLQQLGYQAFCLESSYRNGRKKYPVYVGQFVTKEEAEIERRRLTSDPRFSDAFVRQQ